MARHYLGILTGEEKLYELLLIDDRGREIKNYTPLKEEVPNHLLHVSVSNAVSKIKKQHTHTRQ